MIDQLLWIAYGPDNRQPLIRLGVESERADLGTHLTREAPENETVEVVGGLRPSQPPAKAMVTLRRALPRLAVLAFSRVVQQRSYAGYELTHNRRILPDVGSTWQQQHPGARPLSPNRNPSPTCLVHAERRRWRGGQRGASLPPRRLTLRSGIGPGFCFKTPDTLNARE